MIVQQVNLYRGSLKPKQRDVSYLVAFLTIAFFFIGFSFVSVYLIHNHHHEHELVQQTRSALDTEQARVKILESQIPKQEINAVLVTEVEQWQKKLFELKKTVDILASNGSIKSEGFSIYFQALANQSISEVWLTAIHFDSPQRLINFEGSTFKTDKIPYFLQQLQKEPIFHGRTFAQLSVQKSEKDPTLMNFKLSTRLESSK